MNDLETIAGYLSILASLAGAIYMYRYYYIKENGKND
jgi:hypothetical protein